MCSKMCRSLTILLLIKCIIFLGLAHGAKIIDPPINGSSEVSLNSSLEHEGNFRQGKWFPFYTIGRFQNSDCVGINQLEGTCVLKGECSDANGISTGNCSSLTRQATCCVYQATCGGTTANNNTYFVNPGYPGSWSGGPSCAVSVNPCSDTVCQLRIEFLDLVLAPPNGDGVCDTDIISVTGGATLVPNLCGTLSGQHVIVDFSGTSSISVAVVATASFTFGRHWHIKIMQINCDSANRAPRGCLQYHRATSGVIRSFNYNQSPNPLPNAIGVEGTRQIASLNYGICIRAADNMCTISYSILSSDVFSFTMTGDVGAVDPILLGTGTVQSQTCTTDFIIIPNPTQSGQTLVSDRFCGLGLNPTTSHNQPFVVYAVTDSAETLDIGNRGFALSYSQNACPVI